MKGSGIVFQTSNWKQFTGHCLRRTLATLLPDYGANITLKTWGWKSVFVSEGHIEGSLKNKNDIATKILVRELETASRLVQISSTVTGTSRGNNTNEIKTEGKANVDSKCTIDRHKF